MEKRILIALILVCLYATSQAQSGCATAKLHYPVTLACGREIKEEG